jgi:NAD(P)-dependent dehydrogenase (short-subunit alcohol dehydrogenase family)
MPLDKWQKVIDVNLTGAFQFAQAAGREMLKQQYGRIVSVASVAGLQASGVVSGGRRLQLHHRAGRRRGRRPVDRVTRRAPGLL